MSLRVAIVDYGLGNLYSVQRACVHAGLDATITSDRRDLEQADGIILPGVGAFGDAMTTLKKLDLVRPLKDAVAADKPFMGICLGVQLLMTTSEEFGAHEGLDILKGTVVRFDGPREGAKTLKVPEIGWNAIGAPKGREGAWTGTPLEGLQAGELMYFVHSYCVKPSDPDVILSLTRYGHIDYCSAVQKGELFACQFHPERSGPRGLKVYQTWARRIRERKEKNGQA